jgi:hypothetical protein
MKKTGPGHATDPEKLFIGAWHICADGYPLGAEAAAVRSGRRKLSAEQRSLLESVGFDFTPRRCGSSTEEDIVALYTRCHLELLSCPVPEGDPAPPPTKQFRRCRCTVCGYEFTSAYTALRERVRRGLPGCARCDRERLRISTALDTR